MRTALVTKWIEIQARMDEMIPDHMHDAVKMWLWDGISHGSFLTSVLVNDLKGAGLNADRHNERALGAWVKFFTWHMPLDCWGSRESVSAWAADGGWNGMLAKEDQQTKGELAGELAQLTEAEGADE